MLQHRGQDAAGMATFDGNFHLCKGNGLISDVFRPKQLKKLKQQQKVNLQLLKLIWQLKKKKPFNFKRN